MPVGPVVRDDETAAFFDGTARGEFLLQHCADGHVSSPHAQQCDNCGDTRLIGSPASGGATVVSWAVVPGRPTADGPGSSTILVVAELVEGPWWWSQIVNADPATIQTGTRLRVAFRSYSDQHEVVPVFEIV